LIFLFFLLLWWVEVHQNTYKDSYNISNISYLMLDFYFNQVQCISFSLKTSLTCKLLRSRLSSLSVWDFPVIFLLMISTLISFWQQKRGHIALFLPGGDRSLGPAFAHWYRRRAEDPSSSLEKKLELYLPARSPQIPLWMRRAKATYYFLPQLSCGLITTGH
jgi:hypothetical protein